VPVCVPHSCDSSGAKYGQIPICGEVPLYAKHSIYLLDNPIGLPGNYLTVINIHNPNDQTVRFRKKLAVAFPPGGQEPGGVSNVIADRLAPNEALSVDCDRIKGDFVLTFIHGAEGFLVIESPRSLDVTAVYTAGKIEGEVESIAVEQIRERRK